jgi:hypothetical protein
VLVAEPACRYGAERRGLTEVHVGKAQFWTYSGRYLAVADTPGVALRWRTLNHDHAEYARSLARCRT